MLKVFTLPDLGEGLTESELVEWKVAEGETVTLNQVLAEVETAKAVVELSSPYAGRIARLHEGPGTVVEVGAPIVSFDLPGHGHDDEGGTPDTAAGAETAGDAAGDGAGGPGGVRESSPDGCRSDGRVPTLVGYGAAADGTGRPTRRQRTGRGPAPVTTAPGPPVALGSARPAAPAPPPAERPRSTPPVRRLAKDRGVDLTVLAGTGPSGLITRQDVQQAADGAPAPVTVVPPTAGTAPAAEAAEATEAVDAPGVAIGAVARTLGGRPRTESIPIRGVRKATAAAMTSSAFTAPHVTEFLTVDVTASMELLERLRQHRDFRELKLTPLTLAARAICLAMERTPALNARWDEAGGQIIEQNYVNLGIAAATPRGLMVPNLKDAHALELGALAGALDQLTTTARAGELAPAQLTGGTFTITNIGVFGIDAGTPILNPGEAGILALGQVRRLPWEHGGQIALRQVTTLALSFDHRLVDGEQGSRFLADVGTVLRDPGMALALF